MAKRKKYMNAASKLYYETIRPYKSWNENRQENGLPPIEDKPFWIPTIKPKNELTFTLSELLFGIISALIIGFLAGFLPHWLIHTWL